MQRQAAFGRGHDSRCQPTQTDPLPSPPKPRLPCRSCLGAEADAPSRRLRTKAAGEEVICSELGQLATIFKPSGAREPRGCRRRRGSSSARQHLRSSRSGGGLRQVRPVGHHTHTLACIHALSAVLRHCLTNQSVHPTHHPPQ